MKRSAVVFGMLVVLMIIAGCKITSASPDTSALITIEDGEQLFFKVDGPVETLTTRYLWKIGPYTKQNRDKEFSLNLSKLEDYEISNTIYLNCSLQTYGPYSECYPTSAMCSYYVGWHTVDSVSWSVSVRQDPPVWNGDFTAQKNSDLEVLEGFSSITGNLSIYCYDEVISRLDPLSKLLEVGGNMSIERTGLASLEELSNLTSVGEHISIRNNDKLKSLAGLSNLQRVGGGLEISGNSSLINLELNSLAAAGYKNQRSDLIVILIERNSQLCNSLAEDLEDQVVANGGLNGITLIKDNKICSPK